MVPRFRGCARLQTPDQGSRGRWLAALLRSRVVGLGPRMAVHRLRDTSGGWFKKAVGEKKRRGSLWRSEPTEVGARRGRAPRATPSSSELTSQRWTSGGRTGALTVLTECAGALGRREHAPILTSLVVTSVCAQQSGGGVTPAEIVVAAKSDDRSEVG